MARQIFLKRSVSIVSAQKRTANPPRKFFWDYRTLKFQIFFGGQITFGNQYSRPGRFGRSGSRRGSAAAGILPPGGHGPERSAARPANEHSLEWVSEAESAPIRCAMKFCFDLDVRIFIQLFFKIYFRSI